MRHLEGFFLQVKKTFGEKYINKQVDKLPTEEYFPNCYKNDVAPKFSTRPSYDKDGNVIINHIWINPTDEDMREMDLDYDFIVQVNVADMYSIEYKTNDWEKAREKAKIALQMKQNLYNDCQECGLKVAMEKVKSFAIEHKFEVI